MSAIAIGAAVIGAGAAIYSSNKASKAQGKASDAAAASAAEDLAFQKDKYGKAEEYMKGAMYASGVEWVTADAHIGLSGVGYNPATLDTANLAKSKAFLSKAETAQGVLSDFDGFLQSFKDAMGENSEAMETFSRRYGNIMDNVSDGIMKVSQERLSASGREQLSLDADQMRRDITQKLNVANMNRSGINLELQDRMNMDVEKMARKIDVDSYGQAQGLQAQGTQTLNSIYGIGNQIQGRREGLHMTKGQGMLQNEQFNAQTGTQVNMYNASNQQQANQFNAGQQQATSQWNAGQTNQAMSSNMQATNTARAFAAQAQNTMYANAAQMYANRSQSRLTANNSFYGGVAMPDASNVINAHNAAAASAGKSASGYAAVAGNLAGKAYDAYQNRPQTAAPVAAPASYGGDPLDLF